MAEDQLNLSTKSCVNWCAAVINIKYRRLSSEMAYFIMCFLLLNFDHPELRYSTTGWNGSKTVCQKDFVKENYNCWLAKIVLLTNGTITMAFAMRCVLTNNKTIEILCKTCGKLDIFYSVRQEILSLAWSCTWSIGSHIFELYLLYRNRG